MTPGDDVDGEPPQGATECVFRLPDLGEGLVSGEIVGWLVEVGDQVEVDQPVVVIETQKTAAELPIPYRGRVAQLHGEAKDFVAVGAPLVTIQVPASPDRTASVKTHLVGQRPDMDAASDHGGLPDFRRLPPKPERGRVVASPAVRRLARELDVELRSITGTGKGGVITKDDVDAASRRSRGSAEG